MEGALVCIGRYGMAKTTVDDVARASGVSRATIYRYSPVGATRWWPMSWPGRWAASSTA